MAFFRSSGYQHNGPTNDAAWMVVFASIAAAVALVVWVLW